MKAIGLVILVLCMARLFGAVSVVSTTNTSDSLLSEADEPFGMPYTVIACDSVVLVLLLLLGMISICDDTYAIVSARVFFDRLIVLCLAGLTYELRASSGIDGPAHASQMILQKGCWSM